MLKEDKSMNDWESLNSMSHRQVPAFSEISEEDWANWRWQKQKAITVYRGDAEAVRKLEYLANTWLPGFGLDVQTLSSLTDLWAINISPYIALQLNRLAQTGRQAWVDQMLHWLLPTPQKQLARPVSSKFREGMGTTPRAKQSYPNLPMVCTRLYDDRIIVRISTICPVACQYCFRQYDVAEHHELEGQIREGLAAAASYVADWNKQYPTRLIRDVIFSGGDTLSLNDEMLFRILRQFKQIDGVKLLRLDTKYPAILPQRIMPELASGLKEFQPLLININFTHPGELSPEVAQACNYLADAGIMLGSHTPLLRGVNDDRETLKELFWNLLLLRVRAYYLIQSIDTPGTDYFQVPLERGLELIKHLESELSGPAQPHFIVYTTQGGGKVHLQPRYLQARIEDGWKIETWRGVEFYPDRRE